MSGGDREEKLKECFLKAMTPRQRPTQVKQEKRVYAKNLEARKLGPHFAAILKAKVRQCKEGVRVRDESVKEGREAHEGLWSQAKDLSSQWGPRRFWGRVVIQCVLSCPR